MTKPCIFSPRVVRIFLSYKAAVHRKESVDKRGTEDQRKCRNLYVWFCVLLNEGDLKGNCRVKRNQREKQKKNESGPL